MVNRGRHSWVPVSGHAIHRAPAPGALWSRGAAPRAACQPELVPNRLAASTSPYLQQHANNPVDWFEWGDEAFAQARRLDRPVLVSIGYAACHWCHVMAHESFEDEATASYLNEHYVSVKVDREERPDVDAVYMQVTQAMTGHGGWPMTVFATPDGVPFHAGTYFPPRPVGGMPAFRQVLEAVAVGWREHREQLVTGAAEVRAALLPPPRADLPHGAVAPDAATRQALAAIGRSYDAARGGFGGAPKFPPSMVLEWLLRHHARTGDAAALTMASHTFEAMARGGLYDQLGGGFARYSVDAGWVVPHFEKMLYDNALLLRGYAHWWRVTGSAIARRVTEETAAFLLSELRTPEGGFASSLDADSPDAEGHPREGAYYVWTPGELAAALGPDDAAWAGGLLGVTAAGTFERGASVLQLRADPAGAGAGADRADLDATAREADDAARWVRVRATLAEARAERPRPGRDDKVVAAWNGLAVAALAEAGAILERDDWVEAASSAAQLLVDVHLTEAPPATPSPAPPARVRLARTSRDGVVGGAAGVLEDYADVAEGFLTLHQVTGDVAWLARAGALLDVVLDHFGDGAGGFHDTADDATDPVLAGLARPREIGDGPAPAGQAAAAGALLTYAALTGSVRHREAAERALTEPLLIAPRQPRAVGWALAVTEAALDGPREVAIVGHADDADRAALVRAALLATAPGLVLAVGPPSDAAPLLRDRPLVDGRATAYVCRGFVCALPTTDPATLATQLAAPPTT